MKSLRFDSPHIYDMHEMACARVDEKLTPFVSVWLALKEEVDDYFIRMIRRADRHHNDASKERTSYE